MIDHGLAHLNQSAAGTEISEFHLEAGIASCHCAAPNYGATDWGRILSLYDMLIDLNPSPVIALNRAVALANVEGAAMGLSAVESIEPRDLLENYYLFHAVLGQFHLELKNFEEAAHRFRRAVVGRRLNADGLWFVQNFVFPPKHAHLLPLRKSARMPGRENEDGDEDETTVEQIA